MNNPYSARYVTAKESFSAELQFFNGKVYIRTPIGEFIWDRYSITITKEKGELRITHATEDEKVIAHSDPAIENEIHEQLRLPVNSELEQAFIKHEGLRYALTCLGIIVVIFSLLIIVRSQAFRFAPLVSHDFEVKYGEDLFQKSFKPQVISLNPAAQAKWSELTGKLTGLPEAQKYKWQIDILKDKEVNAMALPGGHIVVFSGLINEAESPEEILGVVSHEMGHVMGRHSVKRIIQESMAGFLKAIVGSGIVGFVIRQADYVNSLSYSRKQELEADKLGLQYMSDAKISTSGIIKFFERQKNKGGLQLNWLSTHPADEERIQRIAKFSQNEQAKAVPVSFSMNYFKKTFQAQ